MRSSRTHPDPCAPVETTRPRVDGQPPRLIGGLQTLRTALAVLFAPTSAGVNRVESRAQAFTIGSASFGPDSSNKPAGKLAASYKARGRQAAMIYRRACPT